MFYQLLVNKTPSFINNRPMFFQLIVNKTRSFMNNRPMFYQLLVNKTLSFMMIGNQRLQRQFDVLLMMGIIIPETC